MLKRVIVLLFFVTLLTPLKVGAVGSTVVINSFRISNGGEANDEYVELLNKGDEEANISNWRLRRKTASGGPSYLRTRIPEGTKIAPGGKLVIAHPLCSCSFGLAYATSTGSTPGGLAADNTIVISDSADVVIDKVGYGTATDVETVGITKSPEDGEVYSRKSGGQDTGHNLNDFYLAYSPPVEEEKTIEKPEAEDEEPSAVATAGADLRVSEFMPNPEGSDTEGEWIEIYNAGPEANITGYAIADRVGSPKKYRFPTGTVMKKNQYLAFYSAKTPISLNNDDEAVEILDPSGRVISYSTKSGKGPEGASYAFDGNGWSWTTKPTPGRGNIIERPEVEKEGEQEGEVLALVDEKDLPTQAEGNISQTQRENDRLLGFALIALAIVGAISYTLYVNKEKLREFYYKVRKRDYISGPKIWQKIKGRRDLFADRGPRRG